MLLAGFEVGRYLNIRIIEETRTALGTGFTTVMDSAEMKVFDSNKELKTQIRTKWICWIPGIITETPYEGIPVLSGPFSGCYFVEYQRADGLRYVGHIGTDIDSIDRNTTVKHNWITSCPPMVDNCYKPSDGFNVDNMVSQIREDQAVAIYGLIVQGKCYSLDLWIQERIGPTEIKTRIGNVRESSYITGRNLWLNFSSE